MHYDGLSKELAEELEARSRDLAMDALKAANRVANTACEKDAGGSWRWNFGVYVYREESAATSEVAAVSPASDRTEP